MSDLIKRVAGAVEVSASVIVVESVDDAFFSFGAIQTMARMGHLPHHWSLAEGLKRCAAIADPPYWTLTSKKEFALDPVGLLTTWFDDKETRTASSQLVCGACCHPWPKNGTTCTTAGCKGESFKRAVPLILTGIHHYLEGNGFDPAILELMRACAQTVQDPNSGVANRRPLIILVPPGTRLPASLVRLGIRLDEPLPTRDVIRGSIVPNFVQEASASPRWKPLVQTLGEDFPAAATDQLAGLSRPEIRTALKMALISGREAVAEGSGDFRGAVVGILGEKKREALRSAHGLELMDPVDPATCGGMPLLREWISHRVQGFSQKARDAQVPQPRGFFLFGLPGTGKSLAAKAAGSLLQWPTVRIDIGAMFGSLVGESEGQMRKALQVVEAVAPCVLLADELDKSMGGALTSNDSGVSLRILGIMLTWLQERGGRPEAPVFFIATANRIEGLPPELVRKGRVDEVFFVDLPNAAEREEILRIHLRRVHGKLESLTLAIEATNQFSGAEIAAAVDEAALTCFQRGEAVTGDAVARAANETRPLARTMPEQIESMRRFAEHRARRATPVEATGPQKMVEIDLGASFGFPTFGKPDGVS